MILLSFLYFENLLECRLGKACSVKLTNELCNRIVFSFCADCSCDAVILEDGQEELNKVWCVGRSDHIQHLDREILDFVVMHKPQPATFSVRWNMSVWLWSLEKQYRYLQAIFCSQLCGGSKNKLNIIHLCHYYLFNKLLINTSSKKEVCWGLTFSLVTVFGLFCLQDDKQLLPLLQSIWWGRYPCWVSPDTCECNWPQAEHSHDLVDEPFCRGESSSTQAEDGQ